MFAFYYCFVCYIIAVTKSTAIGGLHNSNSIRDMFIVLNTNSKKIKGSQFSHLFSDSIDLMDYKESLENLLVLSDNYSTNDCM